MLSVRRQSRPTSSGRCAEICAARELDVAHKHDSDFTTKLTGAHSQHTKTAAEHSKVTADITNKLQDVENEMKRVAWSACSGHDVLAVRLTEVGTVAKDIDDGIESLDGRLSDFELEAVASQTHRWIRVLQTALHQWKSPEGRIVKGIIPPCFRQTLVLSPANCGSRMRSRELNNCEPAKSLEFVRLAILDLKYAFN